MRRAWLLSFTVQGRSRRSELIAITFWLSALVSMALVVLAFALAPFGGVVGFDFDAQLERLRLIVAYAQLLPLPALAARRLHDTGQSGWFALPILPLCLLGAFSETMDVLNGYNVYRLADHWPVLPYVIGPLVVIYLIALLQPSRPGADRYGPDPRF